MVIWQISAVQDYATRHNWRLSLEFVTCIVIFLGYIAHDLVDENAEAAAWQEVIIRTHIQAPKSTSDKLHENDDDEL